MPVKVFSPHTVSIYTRKRKTSNAGKEYWGFEPVTLGKGRKPSGPFYLRHTAEDGKQKWVPAGDAFPEATALRDKMLAAKHAQRKGLSIDESDRQSAEVLGGQTLKDAIDDFMKAKQHKRPRTLQAYRTTLNNFRECLSHRVRLTYDLSGDHVWQFVECMSNDGLKPKTINTRVMYVRIFLKHINSSIKVKGRDLPRVPTKPVKAYPDDELRKLVKSAEPEEHVLFSFFLGTGLREKEAQFAE